MDRPRAAWRVGLAALGLAMLLVPPLTIRLSGTAATDPLWTTLRLAALVAFTLITANILIGAFRPLLNRLAKPRSMHRFHVTLGLAGFAIALAHGIMITVFGLAGYEPGAVWMGPVVLVLLVWAILTALARRTLRRSWRWIHRVNYLVFAAALAHGLILGYDLGQDVFLKVCFGVYAAAVAAGLAYRIVRGIQDRGKTGRTGKAHDTRQPQRAGRRIKQ